MIKNSKSILYYIIVYIIVGFIGWIWEYIYSGFTKDKCGDSFIKNYLKICIPFLNIYAIGAIILILINKIFSINVIYLSILAGLILSTYECISGYISKYINKGKREWDYRGKHFIPLCSGYTSVEVFIFWVISAIIFYKFLEPVIDRTVISFFK